MWPNRKMVDIELRRKLEPCVTEDSTIIIFPGLEEGNANPNVSLAALQSQVERARKTGAKKILLGVGVMPSSLVEPVKALVDELLVLRIPRYFKHVGQFYAAND